MLVATSLDGSDSLFVLSFLFTDKAYNGGTLETQATVNRFEPVREVPVVSGIQVPDCFKTPEELLRLKCIPRLFFTSTLRLKLLSDHVRL